MSFQERKAIAKEILTSSNFDSFLLVKVEQIARALNLPFNSHTQVKDVKESMARWMTESITHIKNDIDAYCASIFPEGPPRDFLISVLKAYNNKIFGDRPMESYESYMKNPNPYMNYPMPYMYPNQQYMMPMYPPYPSDQQSYENMEKMYKMHNPYYMHPPYMHMPMQYPSPNSHNNRLSYPYSMYNNQPQKMPDMNAYQNGSNGKQPQNMSNPSNMPHLPNIPYPPNMPNSQNSHQKPIEPKEPNSCSTRTPEEYEQAYKRYQEYYNRENSENPFIIIPPSKQTEKKKQPQYHLIPNNSTAKPNVTKVHKQINDESSEIQVLDKNSETVKMLKQKKKGEVPANSEKKIVYDEKFKFCECKGTKNEGNSYRCRDCGVFYHYACTSKKEKPAGKTKKIVEIDILDEEENVEKVSQKNNEVNVEEELQLGDEREETCHFCFMKNIDPLNEVTKVAKTCYIRKIHQNRVLQICNFQPFDSYIIAKNSPYEIQLRCMRMQDAANQLAEYTWPDQCLVTLNGQKTIQFPALQQNSSVKKRKDMSVFLTNNIFNYTKNMNQRNHSRIGIEIKYISNAENMTKKIKNNYVFIFGIYLSKKKTVDELYEEIMMDPSNKVNFVQNYFSMPVDEQEVAIEQIKVNLVDPYTWNLIQTPARGNKCNHGQCFDLKTFIAFMNVQRNRNWRCPICMKECRKFCVDQEQMGVIQEYKKQVDNKRLSREVTFHRDGRTLFNVNEESDEDEDNNNNEKGKSSERENNDNDKMDEQKPYENPIPYSIPLFTQPVQNNNIDNNSSRIDQFNICSGKNEGQMKQ